MSASDTPAVDLVGLRRLLGESERDVVALSREEADRIIGIRDHDRRLRAYLRLRELWAYAGDRLTPEDEARIQASFAGAEGALAIEPPPAAPQAHHPLTPLSLLSWAEAWRSSLVSSALKRGVDGPGPQDVQELGALLGGSDPAIELHVPEIGIIRQLDTLIGELRDGLDARQLLPGEALTGHTGNLAGLVKATAAARARRDIIVPAVPAMPAARCRTADILEWLEALLLFEEAIGARALMQAGIVPEPGEARARFLAGARLGQADIAGHAAPQLASWRRAEAVHRAVSGAVRAGWLTRDRGVVLPSFDATELEVLFGVFAAGLPALPPPPKSAAPAEAAAWWRQRRTVIVRSIALNLLADGTLRGIDQLDRRAEEMAIRGLVHTLPEVGSLAEADAVLAACAAAASYSGDIGQVEDVGNGSVILGKWGGFGASTARPVPALTVTRTADQPKATEPESAAASNSTAGVKSTEMPAVVNVTVPPRPVREPRRWRSMFRRAFAVGWYPLIALGSVAAYQAAALGYIYALRGGEAYRAELALRLARAGDPIWIAAGALLVLSALLLTADFRPGGAGRRWGLMRVGRVAMALGIAGWALTLKPAVALVASAEGFPVWPEHVVQRGGVSASTIVAAEGFWLRSRAVEPMVTEDLPQVEPGAAPVLLVREVGPFGAKRRWLVANRRDIEGLMNRRLGELRTAPPAALRRAPAP